MLLNKADEFNTLSVLEEKEREMSSSKQKKKNRESTWQETLRESSRKESITSLVIAMSIVLVIFGTLCAFVLTGGDETPRQNAASLDIPTASSYDTPTGIGSFEQVGEVSSGDGRNSSNNVVGEVTYPVEQFNDGHAQYFDYTSTDGREIRYFIIKSSDGKIRSVFDACRSCVPSKGYVHVGNDMVCRNCDGPFPINRLGEIVGECGPIPLSSRVENGMVKIAVNDLVQVVKS